MIKGIYIWNHVHTSKIPLVCCRYFSRSYCAMQLLQSTLSVPLQLLQLTVVIGPFICLVFCGRSRTTAVMLCVAHLAAQLPVAYDSRIEAHNGNWQHQGNCSPLSIFCSPVARVQKTLQEIIFLWGLCNWSEESVCIAVQLIKLCSKANIALLGDKLAHPTRTWSLIRIKFSCLYALCWFQTSLPLCRYTAWSLLAVWDFQLSGVALSLSGITPELNRIHLSAICHGGQSNKVIDLLAWCLSVGHPSAASGQG